MFFSIAVLVESENDQERRYGVRESDAVVGEALASIDRGEFDLPAEVERGQPEQPRHDPSGLPVSTR